MTVVEQLEKRQPQLYNFLIDCFNLDFRRTQRAKAINYEEDDPLFNYFKEMMEKPRGVKL